MAKKINYGYAAAVNFEEIRVGEIFYCNDFIFIRTEDSFEYDSEILNAICLNDGSFERFGTNDKVQKIDIEINVKFI